VAASRTTCFSNFRKCSCQIDSRMQYQVHPTTARWSSSRLDAASEDAADALFVRNAEVAWLAAGLEHRRRCQPLQLIRPACTVAGAIETGLMTHQAIEAVGGSVLHNNNIVRAFGAGDRLV